MGAPGWGNLCAAVNLSDSRGESNTFRMEIFAREQEWAWRMGAKTTIREVGEAYS